MHQNPWNEMEASERKHLISMTDKMFGENVRAARRVLGWSQRRLADEVMRLTDVEIDPSAMTRIEAGSRRVSLQQALAITIALDEVVIDELVWADNKGPVDLNEWLEILEKDAAESAARRVQAEHELRQAQERSNLLARQIANVRTLMDTEGASESGAELNKRVAEHLSKSKAERLAERDG